MWMLFFSEPLLVKEYNLTERGSLFCFETWQFSRNSQCFLLLLTDCWYFHGLKSGLDIVSRKTMILLCSVYLRNPAVQSMRLCGKERGVATWLSMKLPPRLYLMTVCWQTAFVQFGSHLIPALRRRLGVDGGLVVFPLSFCMKTNFSVGSNGCCTLIRPRQVFILTSIIRLGDFMG